MAPLLVPPATPFTRALDVEQRQATVVGQIARQYLGLAVPDLDLTQTVNLPDDSSVGDLSTELTTAVTGVDLSGVGSFTFVPLADVDAAAATNYASEQNRANLDAYRASVGADEVTDLVVRFEVGGQSFLGFFSALRYGDAWWLDQIGGNFAVLVGVDPVPRRRRSGRRRRLTAGRAQSGHSASQTAIWSPTFSISRTWVTRSADCHCVASTRSRQYVVMAALVAASCSSAGLGGSPRCSNGMLDSPMNTAICRAWSRITCSGSAS